MNRRNRKKKQTSVIDEVKSRITGIDKEKLFRFWSDLPGFHRKALMVIVPVFLLVLVVPVPKVGTENRVAAEVPETPKRVEVGVNTTSLSEQRSDGQKVVRTSDWEIYTVQSGDTLSKVFRTNNLPMSDLNELIAIEGLDKPLSKIKAGQLIRYKLTAEGNLDILQLEKGGTSVMFFRLSGGGFDRSK